MVTIQQLFIGDENAKLRYLGIDLVSGSNRFLNILSRRFSFSHESRSSYAFARTDDLARLGIVEIVPCLLTFEMACDLIERAAILTSWIYGSRDETITLEQLMQKYPDLKWSIYATAQTEARFISEDGEVTYYVLNNSDNEVLFDIDVPEDRDNKLRECVAEADVLYEAGKVRVLGVESREEAEKLAKLINQIAYPQQAAI